MKYFTPELVARGQADDDRVVAEVERRWDELCQKYSAYVDSIKPRFPAGLRLIEENYYLHDAEVRGMGQRDGHFVIVLRLDTPPRALLTLAYQMVAAPVINRDAMPPEARLDGEPLWQYDEIEEVAGDPPTWSQSILLSNGWEVRLHFRDVKVEEAQALIPTHGQDQVIATVARQST